MTAPASTHLVIADDHPLFRDALRQAVASVVASAKVDEAGTFDELTALLEQDSDVDLVLLDLTMPGISGFSGLIYLRAQYPAIPVVIVSASDDAGTIRRSLDFGASGFIPKRFGIETLRDAIKKVMDGDPLVQADVTYPPSMIASGISLAIYGARNQPLPGFYQGKIPSKIVLAAELITKQNAKSYYQPESIF